MAGNVSGGPLIEAETSSSQSSLAAWVLRVVAGIGGALLVLWIVVAAVAAPRGLDLSDESFYLLSYRWWSTDTRAFSGVQYFYGPIYQMLGYDIAGLRVFRIATVVVANAGFGWAFMRWLGTHREWGRLSGLWTAAGVLLVTAIGGLAMSWLPKSPGYNDVAALGALLVAAGVLELSRSANLQRLPSWLVGGAIAPVAFTMLLTKWASAVVTLGSLAVVAVVVVLPLGRRGVVRVVAPFLASLLATAVVFQVAIASLDRVVSQMVETNRLVAAATNSPRSLVAMYADSTIWTVVQILTTWWPFVLACVAAPFLRGRVLTIIGVMATLATLAVCSFPLLRDGAYWGGTIHLNDFLPVVTAGIVLAALLWVSSALAHVWDGLRAGHRSRLRDSVRSVQVGPRLGEVAVVLLLVLLPVLQAAGTGNPILYLAVSCYAPWLALVIWVWSGISVESTWAAWVCAAAIAVLMVSSSTAAAVTGTWYVPYRTTPASGTTAAVRDVPVLTSIRLDPSVAAEVAAYVEALRPWTREPGRRMMAFDELAGWVLVVNGRTVGEAWYSALDPERTALGIEAACRESGPLTSEKPIILFNRAPIASDDRALRACGLDRDKDYRKLDAVPPALGLVVFVPKDTP
ncbi:MAG TPA: hypothetical protein PLA44_06505 [Propionibacteriaceae bacterium]|nr:hypothetical protein [Propionibacteriaceae bacterium]